MPAPGAEPAGARKAAAGEGGHRRRELYIDAFRGLMALVMVQGHLFDALLLPEIRESALYRFQLMFHGSTAPGFLFASGFVAGLPRAPLSLRGSVRRARRLLFVLGVGYALHLPYLSFWKIVNEATPAQKAQGLACDALNVIAVSQLFVLLLQWVAGRQWLGAAGGCALAVIAATPAVWSSDLSARLPLALGAYLDKQVAPSQFPVFPFAAFVLAGTVAGGALGRQERRTRRRRGLAWGLGLIALGYALSFPLEGRVDFWGPSPAYTLIRLGGLLLLLLAVEAVSVGGRRGVRTLALYGHETLHVYVLHLYLLFGGVMGFAPLGELLGLLSLPEAAAVLASMLGVLLGTAWLWHRAKAAAPHRASLLLSFLGTLLLWEFFTRPW